VDECKTSVSHSPTPLSFEDLADRSPSLIETHNKTAIVFGSFTITFGGWWAWNAFLSGVYSNNVSPYDVKGGFSGTFGKDPIWWLTFVVVIAILVVMELSMKAVMKALSDVECRTCWKGKSVGDLEEWQEIEKQVNFRKRVSQESKDLDGE
jgi:phospholipid-translocating ATPase